MRKFTPVFGAAATAIILLTGCASGGGAGGAYVAGNGGYDVWYDGFYGPYPGGYWDGDGFLYYSDRDRGYHRDDGNHFRHDQFDGGNGFRSRPSR